MNMECKKDFAVEQARKDLANYVRVCLRYGKERKGVYLHIIPMIIESFEANGIEYERATCTWNGKIYKVAEMTRKSEKKFNELLAKLEPNFERFARAFEKNPDWLSYDVRCALGV